MVIFPLPTPDTTHISLINMIFSSASRSLGSVDPWVVPHPKDGHSHRALIPYASIDINQQIHPRVEFDQPYLPIWVVDSFRSHDFLDTKLP
jgi:hypothetical protein